MLKDLDNDISVNDGIVFVHAESDNAKFFSDNMDLVNVYLNTVSLDDVNFDDDDPETIIIYIRLMDRCNRNKQ